MQFHLNYIPEVSQQKITHYDDVLLIGSCFSEHIGNKMTDLKFKVSSNPFGIVFNPKSIKHALDRIIERNYFNDNDVFEKDNVWYSLEAHSSLSGSSKNELVEKLNQYLTDWNLKLQTVNFLIITFGSAFAYKHKEQHKIVVNCHKLPGSLFEKDLLEANSIISDYNHLIQKLKTFNPQLNILFTVSPVKHLRDGVVENSLSKAILIESVHQLIRQHSNCFYFPAYELVNDDLRDYRFYEADMAHPNQQTINYVWQKFSDCYFNNETQNLNKKLIEILQATKHRPFNNDSEAHRQFKNNFLEKCKTLSSNYPMLDLRSEINYFSK